MLEDETKGNGKDFVASTPEVPKEEFSAIGGVEIDRNISRALEAIRPYVDNVANKLDLDDHDQEALNDPIAQKYLQIVRELQTISDRLEVLVNESRGISKE